MEHKARIITYSDDYLEINSDKPIDLRNSKFFKYGEKDIKHIWFDPEPLVKNIRVEKPNDSDILKL